MIFSRKTVEPADDDQNEKSSRSVVTKTVEKTGGVRTTTTTFKSCTREGIDAALTKLDIDPKKFHSGGTSVTKTIIYTDSSGKREVLEEVVETYGDPDKIARENRQDLKKEFNKVSIKTDTQKMGSCMGKESSAGTETTTAKKAGVPKPKADLGSMKTGQFEEDCLKAHNDYRAKHGVPPLVLSKEICAYSKEWANHLAATDAFKHRTQAKKYGENIFMKWSSDPNHAVTGSEAVDSWYSEIKDHVFGREPTSLKSGHGKNNMQLLQFVDKDPRVPKWTIMQRPIITISVVLTYLAFVTVLGPKWMKNRKAFGLQKTMIVYNFFMAVANAWVFHKLGKHGWYGKHSWICEPVNKSYNEDTLGTIDAFCSLLILKLIELTDTVIFILRKKSSQITFLHVLHHAQMPIIGWYLIVREPGGYNTLFAFINTLVHTVMYTYYGLAALGPTVQKYLWWKKYITALQIGQFVIIFFIMIRLAIAPPCEVSTDIVAVNLLLATVFLGLFLNFYFKSYKPKSVKTDQTVRLTTNGARTSELKTQKNEHDSTERVIGNKHTKEH